MDNDGAEEAEVAGMAKVAVAKTRVDRGVCRRRGEAPKGLLQKASPNLVRGLLLQGPN